MGGVGKNGTSTYIQNSMAMPPYGREDGAADLAGTLDGLAVCRQKRAASPVQILHSNGTQDGVESAQQDPCQQQHSRIRWATVKGLAIVSVFSLESPDTGPDGMIEKRAIELANTGLDGEGCEEEIFMDIDSSPHKKESLRLPKADESAVCQTFGLFS